MSADYQSSFSEPGFYRIEVQGRLSEMWCNRLGAMQVSVYVPNRDGPVTLLQGAIKDQPELAGIIKTFTNFT